MIENDSRHRCLNNLVPIGCKPPPVEDQFLSEAADVINGIHFVIKDETSMVYV
jgi:hypothetical protein